jgi:Tfp pilus assembly PilM family ATPase
VTHTPIGLDIGTSWIKAAQWVRRDRVWRIRSAAWARRTPAAPWSESQADSVAQVLRRRGFTGSSIVLTAPGDKARVVEIEVPIEAIGAGRTAAARMEIARACRVEPSAFEFECWDLPKTGRSGDNALAASMLPHFEADALVLHFAQAGLTTRRIAPPASAFGVLAGPDPDLITGFADLGASALTLTVLVGGVCVYERRLTELGLNLLVDTIAASFGLDRQHAERLLRATRVDPESVSAKAVREACRSFGNRVGREIAVSCEYASHRFARATDGPVYALGGGACDATILRAASDAAGVTIQPAPRPAADLADGPECPWSLSSVASMVVSPHALAPRHTGAAP